MFVNKVHPEAVEIFLCIHMSFTFKKKQTNLNERKFVISIQPGIRSTPGPKALLSYALYVVNLLGIAARYLRVHLLVVEKVTSDVEI